jgi:hypothetical protein
VERLAKLAAVVFTRPKRGLDVVEHAHSARPHPLAVKPRVACEAAAARPSVE